MLIDSLVAYGLHVWEKRLKEEKAKILHEENDKKEAQKKSAHDTKQMTRQQPKIESKKVKNQGKAYPGTKPRGHIVQPDKTK